MRQDARIMTICRVFTMLVAAGALAVSACGSSSDDAATPDAGACPARTGSGTSHQGNIEADQTWTAATGPHIVEFNLQIKKGTLTIEPCAVVRVKKGMTITVGDSNPGTPATGLVARGTAAQPIVITAAVAGEPWGMLAINGSATVDLEQVTLSEGADHGTAQNLGGTLKIVGRGGTQPLRNTRVKNVRIDGSAGYGINVQSAGGFTADSSGLVIVNSGKVPSPSADTSYPIYVTTPSVQTLPPGTYTGNAKDQILVGVGVTQDYDETFHDLGVPYRLKTNFSMAPLKSAAEGGLTTLTIDAGVKILLLKEPGNLWGITLGGSRGDKPEDIWPTKVVAAGTEARPIVFSSAAAAPAAGDWAGIGWAGGPAMGNVMSYVRVEFAGGEGGTAGFGCGPVRNDAAIIITNWRPATAFMDHLTVSDSAAGGIVSGWASDADGPNLKTGNTFTSIANGCAVSRWKNASSPACPGSGAPTCL